jgi:hypothetical protein
MGGIWSSQQVVDDEDTNSVDGNDSESTDASEDEKSNSPHTPPSQVEKHEKTSNNTTSTNNEKNTKYTHKDKDKPTRSDSITSKNHDNNGNNDDQSNNNNNKNTTVHKTLNVDTKPEEHQPTTRQWRSNSARGLKRVELQNVNILVVDDDAVQRAVLRKWLHDEKYKNGILIHLDFGLMSHYIFVPYTRHLPFTLNSFLIVPQNFWHSSIGLNIIIYLSLLSHNLLSSFL